ncbi:TetR family transcriptional regulator [Anabaena sp. FACHB-709]|uniref:TetR family transcriptional regulator protein n=2 Tax=Nostocaceae TaxID=1162 RepID=A0A1Z4KNS0_ANAVA|nr:MULTISPECIES: TetR/AcrR family transcriptional regulator [Nostocaceae]BAY70598.1 TetR family transcriptional regulator protein [Trichormus variabilis NIES-23]HBW32730.1 TetR/AcrR family transcriptional regulator [Nostoc sp. UBA8866]MBD2172563.1 TetR/AcrR family transcriptional regulator [Anabaena cylindrica FACHB-318]MBD2264465.1 TetR/AcrR family transcriptional regulator [Anabaena sp. FACHB-709]MBD2274236.1 TetR/AcrR family transcriptional regulator [Nostoc sp. PCC 7120 = FACHB-418]
MVSPPLSTRQRLIQAALELFTAQGVSGTTTRQIAEKAAVNEVTLFRNFGNKHGLLLAVLEESAAFTNLGESLVQRATPPGDVYQALKDYASDSLHALERVPELVRSVVGEADQFPAENRRALGRGLTEANRYVAQYLATVIQQGDFNTYLPAEKLASLLNGMILGYAVIEFTSEFHQLWESRDDFLENLVELFLHGAMTATTHIERKVIPKEVADLPPALVHEILRQARKSGVQDYAIAYVLFAAGLSATEIVNLQRNHQIYDSHGHFLQITIPGVVRQVPVNQWILGKRYGSYMDNPLTKWLKSRKDNYAAMFINTVGEPITESEVLEYWQAWTQALLTPQGQIPEIDQAQHTWRVEMLMRGMSLENLSIITACDRTQLQPYAHRAKEKAALEQATRLDQKPC